MSADPDVSKLPAPPVPSEVDLRGFPYMPLDIQRLLDSDFYAKSSGDEFKAAFTLWSKAFLQTPAGSLPDDDRVLAKLSGTDGRWRKLRPVALHGFIRCSDGRLYHHTLAEVVLRCWRRRVAQRGRIAKRYENTPVANEDAMNGHPGSTAVDTTVVPLPYPGSTSVEPGSYRGATKGSQVKGGEVEVPPPSPTTTSSSASSERARAREGGGNGEAKLDDKGENLPAENGLVTYDPEKCEFIGLSEKLRLKWQGMFDTLSIPDQVDHAAAWLHAYRDECAAIERLGDGFEPFLIRWLLRESSELARRRARASGN